MWDGIFLKNNTDTLKLMASIEVSEILFEFWAEVIILSDNNVFTILFQDFSFTLMLEISASFSCYLVWSLNESVLFLNSHLGHTFKSVFWLISYCIFDVVSVYNLKKHPNISSSRWFCSLCCTVSKAVVSYLLIFLLSFIPMYSIRKNWIKLFLYLLDWDLNASTHF